MAGETTLTIIGNLTNDPELRFTPGSGDAVANFSVASTPRTFDRNANEWKDGETLFMRCAAWRELGENAAESLQKGMRVIVTGTLKSRKYTPKEGGEERTVIELEVAEIGPSLKYATAVVNRTQRNGQSNGQGGGFGGQQGQQGGFGGGQQTQPAGNGWGGQQGAQQGAQQGNGWGNQQTQQGGQYAGGSMAQGQQVQQAAVAEDPWATPGVQQGNPQAGWGNQQGQQGGQRPSGEPPF
jgi:single-strand DNA-binding protein